MEIKTKCCSRCQKVESEDKFIKNRNICRECSNKRSNENTKKRKDIFLEEEYRICSNCNENKLSILFTQLKCNNCTNKNRREYYNNNEIIRIKLIKKASEFKHIKVIERQQLKLEEIGEGNKKCKYCDTIKPEDEFRHNRLKCRDCERDNPLEKFKRNIRARIWWGLNNKDKHTIEYLGCNYVEYFKWILTNEYNLENKSEWHIDHVIPISTFNLDNEEEQLLAFNWRNTMPLSAKENLSKNNRIDKNQVEQHYKKLVEYHIKNNIKMPQKFIELFAKHLVAGSSLEL